MERWERLHDGCMMLGIMGCLLFAWLCHHWAVYTALSQLSGWKMKRQLSQQRKRNRFIGECLISRLGKKHKMNIIIKRL